MPPTPKLIRELRMGPPKTWKTGSVVSTYPRPLIVFEGDEGGLDVVREPITFVSGADLPPYCTQKRETLPPLMGVQFNVREAASLNDLFKPTGDTKTFNDFNATINNLFLKGCPWKTVVIDPVTVIQDIVLASFAMSNAKKMEDAQKWAGSVGEKVKRIMATLYTLPCHVVIIMHTAQKDVINPDTRQVISTTQEPVLYGKVRNFIGSLPSQFFYQDAMTLGANRKVFIKTLPDSKVQGIGARWPADLLAEITPPTFDNIYGKCVATGETYK